MVQRLQNLEVISDSYSKEVSALDCVETVGAESKIIFSVPVAEHSAFAVSAAFFVFDMGFAFGAIGTSRIMVLRATGVPVLVGTDTIDVLTNIAGAKPTLEFVPNAPNREIDVTITGKAGLTLHWHMELAVARST